MKLFSLFFSLLLLAIAMTSCDPAGPISLDGCIELTGRQESPLTLTNHIDDPNRADYCVAGNYDILADVVVEPGVTILMKNGAKITVKTGGSFQSIGTETEKITIRGELLLTAGQWKYIRFNSDNTDNRLEHTNINGGGSDDTYDAMVFIGYNAYAKIDNCNVSFSQSHGIKCEDGRSRLGGLANTDVSFCEIFPVHIDAKHLRFIESTNSGTGNGNDKINVKASQLSDPTTWKKSPLLPYRLDGSLSIIDEVTVEAGTSIFMASGAKIRINGGSLNCVGTESEKIRFLADNWTSGSWGYISFISSNSSNNRFEHCVISDGGGNMTYQGMITLIQNARCQIGNSEISGSAGYGVQNQSNRSTLVDDGNNTFSENALGNFGD
ncbi:MAG: hypothetical protein AAF927_22135 [Bacteroidota bacterium]